MRTPALACVLTGLLLLHLAAPGAAQVAPPSRLRAGDASDFAKVAIQLRWDRSPTRGIRGYRVLRATGAGGEFVLRAQLPPAAERYVDVLDSVAYAETQEPGSHATAPDPEQRYSYRIVTVSKDGALSVPLETAEPVGAARGLVAGLQWKTAEWFDWSRGWFMIVLLVICGAVVVYIRRARTGKLLKVRKIAGLEAVEEAVGRATEMGRSVLFIPGIQDMNEIQTIAGITILSRVAKTAAEFDARVEVPTSRSLVMTTAREAVQAAFLAAGRPDAYNQDLIYYVTDEQFGFVAYLSGLMVREKPAACFYMGAFFAESLILAEMGNSIGAIQVAGTAMPAQLPFFVAACDYTLIGEEFFAASAYLSGSPEELGSLKGQDVGKMLVAGLLLAGCAIATAASITQSDALHDALRFVLDSLLT